MKTYNKEKLESLFQPTLPVRGATDQLDSAFNGPDISTHAPRAGSDTENGVVLLLD